VRAVEISFAEETALLLERFGTSGELRDLLAVVAEYYVKMEECVMNQDFEAASQHRDATELVRAKINQLCFEMDEETRGRPKRMSA